MHNLHFILVDAESHDEAIEDAIYILDGNSTYDYYNILGSINRKTEKFVEYDTSDRFVIDTLRQIQGMINKIYNEPPSNLNTFQLIDIIMHRRNYTKYEMYQAKEYVNWLYETYNNSNPFWNASLYPYEFYKIGVTNELQYKDETNHYVVIVDIHS